MRGIDLSVAQRLALGFLALFATLLMAGSVAVDAHSRSDRAGDQFNDVWLPRERAADRLERALLRAAIAVRSHLAGDRITPARDALADIDTRWRAVVALDADAARLEPLRAVVYQFAAAARQVIEADLQSDDGGAAALVALRERALADVGQYRDEQRLGRQQAFDRMLAETAKARQAMLYGAGGALLMFALIGWATARSVQRPVARLASAAVAMRRGDWQPALALSTSDPDSPDELARLGSSLANCAAALQYREAELEGETRLAAACSASLDPADVARAALDVLARHFELPVGAVYRPDDAGRLLLPVARYGLPASLQAVELGHGVVGEAARQREPVFLSAPAEDSPYVVHCGFDATPVRYIAAVPIVLHDRLLGVLLLGGLQRPAPTVERFLRAAVVHIASSLANADAHQQVENLVDRLRWHTERVQAQNEELQAQSEEIQAQAEELQAQNEQILSQNDELQAQTEEVLAQQEQLQAHNEELQRQREQLRAQAEHLQAADAHKNHFLGVLAHELRNPMAPISNGLQILMQHDCDAAQTARVHAMLARQTRHLIRLIDDLLDVTRISEKKIALQCEALELTALLRDVADDFETQARERRLRLVTRIDEQPAWIDGDPTRVAQVVGNLLCNALKFSAPDNEVELRLAVDRTGERACISVIDHGEGIPADVLPTVFEPFVQGPAGGRPNAGLGLGLALVRELVELHGGCVEAHSDGPGSGARFDVHLPLRAPVTTVSGQDVSVPGVEPQRILLIEDKQDVADSLSALLALYGHTVVEAATGNSGVEAAAKAAPDLVLCDLGLPDIDGFTVARKLRGRFGQRLLLCALSGHASDVDRRRSLEAGFDHHFAKPLDIERFHRLIAHRHEQRMSRAG